MSLRSLIHVFVWNMSRLAKHTIKHNQSTLLRKTQRTRTDRRRRVKVDKQKKKKKKESVNEDNACAYTNV